MGYPKVCAELLPRAAFRKNFKPRNSARLDRRLYRRP
jgi:hypothetical protein